MYLPQQFEEARLNVLQDLIRSHPLGALVILSGTELSANHIPFFLRPEQGERGTLCGHVARANPVWRQLDGTPEALVIFQGPQSYITPSWYPSKHADGKVVPTWNYSVVHAYGRPRAIEKPDWLLGHVTQLTAAHETGLAQPWHVSDAPNDYIAQMISRIVGIEISITKLIGKWKVSQNRSPPDRLAVAAGLDSQGTDRARAMADLVRQRAEKP